MWFNHDISLSHVVQLYGEHLLLKRICLRVKIHETLTSILLLTADMDGNMLS